MRIHAIHSPSKLPMYEKCLLWTPDGKESDIALRGTNYGEQLANYLQTGIVPDIPELGYAIKCIDSIMAVNILMVGGHWEAEPKIMTSVENVWGYADVVYKGFGEAILVEFKSGYGDREPASNNLQVQAYVLGLLEEGFDNVIAYLIEIDKKTVSEYLYTQKDLLGIKQRITELILQRHEAQANGYKGNPAGCCSYCGKQSECEALKEGLDNTITALQLPEQSLPTPQEYTDKLTTKELSAILKKVIPAFDLAEKYVGALKAKAIEIIEAGGEVEGWTVKEKRGNRIWADEMGAMQAIVDKGIEIMQVAGLRSPAQVEKIIKDKKLIEPFITYGTPKKSLIEVKNV